MFILFENTATPGDAVVLPGVELDPEPETGVVKEPETESVVYVPVVETESVVSVDEDALFLRLDALIELQTYSLSVLFFLVVVVLARLAYKFIRIFIS